MQFVAPYSIVASSNFAVHFHPDHLADLRKSGLFDETIKAAGVYSLAPTYISRFFPPHRAVPEGIGSALCFPYQGGEFARIKLFPPLEKMKYAQPPKTGARLYVPFQIGQGPIYVCEGEKKTLAAHQTGLHAVGIGGLWSWLTNGEPIADSNQIQSDGREVTIIPDSDVWTRVDLLRAVYALGRELQSQGGTVYILQIPQPGDAKVGLDDFVVAGGNVNALEVFALSHHVFKNCRFWYGRWRFKKALAA